MPIFISHVTLTSEGVQALKELPGRIEDNKKLWAECGGKLLRWDVVLGDYDYLLVTEAPNEKVMAEIAIKASRRGRTSFKTFCAIPVEEFGSVAERL
jgi:uncharacterized protein with GYD domain